MSSWYMRRSSALPQRRTPYATARSLKRDSDLPNVSSARVPFLDRLLHLVLAAAGEPRVLRVPHDVGHATCPERGVELLLVDHRGHLARPGREARALHGAQVIPGNQVHREAARTPHSTPRETDMALASCRHARAGTLVSGAARVYMGGPARPGARPRRLTVSREAARALPRGSGAHAMARLVSWAGPPRRAPRSPASRAARRPRSRAPCGRSWSSPRRPSIES